MSPWFVPAGFAALFIAVHYLFLRAASGRIGDALGALILEGTAALGILGFYLLAPKDSIATTRAGVITSAASGLAISGASILLFAALRRGGKVATAGTIALGGGVALSALVAPWLFREPFTLRRALGVALGIAAMVVLSEDR